jgi:hypothetical protein
MRIAEGFVVEARGKKCLHAKEMFRCGLLGGGRFEIERENTLSTSSRDLPGSRFSPKKNDRVCILLSNKRPRVHANENIIAWRLHIVTSISSSSSRLMWTVTPDPTQLL